MRTLQAGEEAEGESEEVEIILGIMETTSRPQRCRLVMGVAEDVGEDRKRHCWN